MKWNISHIRWHNTVNKYLSIQLLKGINAILSKFQWHSLKYQTNIA